VARVAARSSGLCPGWRVFLRPITMFAITCALLRFCSISIQDSFYPVYMQGKAIVLLRSASYSP